MGNSRVLQKVTKEITKAKAPGKPRDIIYDPMGQWKHPGENTRIPGGNITMQGVPYPVYAQPNVGQPQMMYPGQDYIFPHADYVDEYPQMKRGGYTRGLVPMPKPSKKGLASKAYSRSLDATNKLFTENRLFEKPKDRRRKVFDPNAKYYAEGGIAEEMLVTSSPQDLDPETLKKYLKDLRKLENSVKAGYRKGKWYPHASFEGGSDTIAYGHKLVPGEDFSSGISDEKAEALQKKDVLEKQKVAENFVDKKYGAGTYDSLPQNSQMLLLDYTYNGVINKFPSFVKHVVEGNKEGMLKEYERGSKGRPLKERNEWAKNVIQETDFKKPKKASKKKTTDTTSYSYFPVIQKMTPFQLGGGILEAEYGMPLGAGISQNYEGRTKYKHKVGGIPELPLRDNRVNYDAYVNRFEPKDEYQDGGVSPIEGDLISKVLMNRNRGVDFVDRAYALGDNPGTPLFNVPDDEEFGNRMSHKMAWGTDNQGQTWMFPTVLNPNDEAIKVPNQYADYISSEGYKNATGMNYQDGGQYKTKLTPEEEFDFQSFYRTLPDNLQTDDDTYDIRGYWDSEGRPETFNYDQPKEKDGYYHAYSINQNTGEYLKSPAHDTFQHAVDEDRKIGYRPLTNVYGRNIATENQSIADPEEESFLRNTEGPANYIETELTDDEIQAYREGGYIVEDISIPTLNQKQKGGNSKYVDTELTDAEIQDLIDEGFIVEML